jgi:hypothetical protein
MNRNTSHILGNPEKSIGLMQWHIVKFFWPLLILISAHNISGQCIIDAGEDVFICAGQSTILTAIPLTGCTGPFTFEWSAVPDAGPYPPTQSITVTPTVTTIYTVKVYDGASVPYLDAVKVTINPLPTPTITGPATPCKLSSGSIYSTETGKLGYLWNVSSGGTITSGGGFGDPSVTVTWGNQGLESVSVNYTNSSGCTAPSPTVLPVTVLGPSISGPTNACKGVTGNNYTTESGKTGYDWTYAGGTVTAGGDGFNFVTLTWFAAGSRTVKVQYTDGTCTSLTALPVTVYPTTPSIAGPSSPCKGLTATYTTEPGMTNYTWGVSPGTIVNSGGGTADNTITITWNTVGSQWISCNYTSPYGCTITPYTLNINVIGPTLSGATNVCELSEYTYTTEPGMGNTYSWTVAGGNITGGGGSSNNTCKVKWITPGAGSVTVSYTNGVCTASTTLPVIIHSLTPAITGPSSACTHSAAAYTTDPGMSSYIWSVSAGGTPSGGLNTDILNVTWNTAGSQWVQVTYASPYGCTISPATYNVNVLNSPVPTITGPATTCKDTPGNVYTTEAGMTNYAWTVSAGTITAGAGTNSITVTWTAAGAQQVSINYTDANGCQANSPSVLPVTVLGPTLSGPTIVCRLDPGKTYTTEAGKSGYTWTYAGANKTAGGNGFNFVTLTWIANGSRNVKVTYTDGTCTSSTTLPVTVQNSAPTLTGSSASCINVTDTYTTDAGMVPGSYLWTPPPGNTVISGGGVNDNWITIKWNVSGLQQPVTVTYTSPLGCTISPTTVKVDVWALPIPSLTGPSGPFCGSSSGNTYMTDAGMKDYVWAVSPGNSITAGGGANDNTITITWNVPGSQWVSVNYTEKHGVYYLCSAQTPTVLPVNVINPTITGPSTVCNLTTAVYSTEAGMGNTYVWTWNGAIKIAGGGASNNTITLKWISPGSRWVKVTYTNGGCTTSTTLPVTNYPSSPTIAGPSQSCINGSNDFSTEGGMSNYDWSISPGGTINGPANTSSVNVTWNVTGTQWIKCNYLSPYCTITPTILYLNVWDLPVPSLTGPPGPFCIGSTALFSTDPGKFNYQWSVSPGNEYVGGGTNDNTIAVTWHSGGAHWISVNYTDVHNCTAATPTVQNLTVDDVPPVIISCPSDISKPADPGHTYATISLPSPEYNDNVTPGGDISVSWTMTAPTPGSGTGIIPDPYQFSVGKTTVTYTFKDGCGNSSSCQFDVTVSANDPPVISCPADISKPAEPGLCSASLDPGFPDLVSGTLPVTFGWEMSGATTASGSGGILPNPFNFTNGITTIQWTATNIAGESVCTQVITIADTQPPSFTLPTLANGYCVDDIQLATYNPGGIYYVNDLTPPRPDYYTLTSGNTLLDLTNITDNCAGAITIDWEIDFGNDGTADLSGPDQISLVTPVDFPLGANRITWIVTDVNGISSTASVFMTVLPRPDIHN